MVAKAVYLYLLVKKKINLALAGGVFANVKLNQKIKDLKNIKDILFIIQARLNSQRVPNKMLRPFKESNLFRIAMTKVLLSDYIPKDNFYVSICEDELIDIAENKGVNIYKRSYE